MTKDEYRLMIHMVYSSERWRDNGDGTATDTWFEGLNSARGAFQESAALKMREDIANALDGRGDRDAAAAARKVNWEFDIDA